jgi:hypothetical protein
MIDDFDKEAFYDGRHYATYGTTFFNALESYDRGYRATQFRMGRNYPLTEDQPCQNSTN